jgi:hypothetical protein
MKLGVYRVWFFAFTEGTVKGEKYEHRTAPVMKMVAAEHQDKILETLPEPEPGPPGTTVRNVISQIDQRHRDVLFNERK